MKAPMVSDIRSFCSLKVRCVSPIRPRHFSFTLPPLRRCVRVDCALESPKMESICLCETDSMEAFARRREAEGKKDAKRGNTFAALQ